MNRVTNYVALLSMVGFGYYLFVMYLFSYIEGFSIYWYDVVLNVVPFIIIPNILFLNQNNEKTLRIQMIIMIILYLSGSLTFFAYLHLNHTVYLVFNTFVIAPGFFLVVSGTGMLNDDVYPKAIGISVAVIGTIYILTRAFFIRELTFLTMLGTIPMSEMKIIEILNYWIPLSSLVFQVIILENILVFNKIYKPDSRKYARKTIYDK